jgi:hypothetical protein
MPVVPPSTQLMGPFQPSFPSLLPLIINTPSPSSHFFAWAHSTSIVTAGAPLIQSSSVAVARGAVDNRVTSVSCGLLHRLLRSSIPGCLLLRTRFFARLAWICLERIDMIQRQGIICIMKLLKLFTRCSSCHVHFVLVCLLFGTAPMTRMRKGVHIITLPQSSIRLGVPNTRKPRNISGLTQGGIMNTQ